MTGMRVLLLNDLGAPVGGAERSALRLRTLLRDRGHDVRLLTSRAAPPGLPVLADATCAGTLHPRGRVALQTVNPSAVRALRRELRRFRPDVVHLRMTLSQLSPVVLPLLRSVPTVYTAATYEAICPLGTKVLPDGSGCEQPAGLACRRCLTPQSHAAAAVRLGLWRRWSDAIDAVLALSARQAVRLEREGVRGVRVVPNGVPARPARPPLAGPPRVGFAGRLVAEKGADVLVRAVALLADRLPDVQVLIAGEGPQRAALGRLAAALGVAGSIALPGHLGRDALEGALAGAWVQAVPGRWEEPFGNVVTEAMVRGTAVVASDLGGPAEVVRDGDTGTLVPAGDPEALAAALLRYLTDRGLAERVGLRGRTVALAEYTEDRLVERLEAVYDEVTGRVPARSRW